MVKKKIVICGATGKQGGAVAAAMLDAGKYELFILTRDPESAAALKLAADGATVLKANFKDLQSLVDAFKAAYGVFAVTQPWSRPSRKYDIKNEIIQGKNIIWACKTVKVKLLVFSTFFNYSDNETGVSFIDSKAWLEMIIRQEQIPHTILRPGLYFDEIKAKTEAGPVSRLNGNYGADTAVPYVALADIGRFCVIIFDNPGYFKNKTIHAVGEYVSGNRIASLLTAMGENEVRYKEKNKIMFRIFNPQLYRLRVFFEKMNAAGHAQTLSGGHGYGKEHFCFVNFTGFLKSMI